MRKEKILPLVAFGFFLTSVIDGADQAPGRQPDAWSGITVKDEAHAMAMIRARIRNCPQSGASAKETEFFEAMTGLKVPLSEIIGKGQPMVLIFGSESSPSTLKNLKGASQLAEKYGDAVDFYFVYLREAHPAGGFQPSPGGYFPIRDPGSRSIIDAVTQVDRNAAALKFAKETGLRMPVLVDTMDDLAAVRWSAWPSRIVVLDSQARVVYAGGQGPWFYRLIEDENQSNLALAPKDIATNLSERASLEAFLEGFVQRNPPRRLTFPEPQVPDEFSGTTVMSSDMVMKLIQKRIVNAPRAGELAPGFELRELINGESVSLGELHRDRPLVLFFGSYGCGVAGAGIKSVIRIHDRFKNQAEFAMIYIREAHSLDGFDPTKAKIRDPKTHGERDLAAQACRKGWELPFRVLIDGIDDRVATRWGAWPVRLFVIGTNGRVIYAGRQGPWGYRPEAEFQHEDNPLQTEDLFYTGEPLEWFLERYFEEDRRQKTEALIGK